MGQKLEDIQPRRVSLVKRGANRRRILLHKAEDGAQVSDTLAGVLTAIAPSEASLLEAVEKAGGDESVVEAAAAFARAGAALNDAFDGNVPADLLKAMQNSLTADDDNDDEDDSDTEDENDNFAKALVEIRKGETGIYKKDYTAEERRALAAKGHALKDGSYPISDTEDLKNAVTLAQSGHGDVSGAKALIKRRASALGATNSLPDEWKVNKEDGMTETAQAVPVKKEDGTWDLTAVPEESRPAFEAIIKAAEDDKAEALKKADEESSRAENAEKIAKAVQEKIEKAEYVAKAAGFDNLAKSADEIGALLYSVAKAEEDKNLPEGTYKALDELLSGANEAAADVFKTAGRNGHSTGSSDAMSKIDAAAEKIREANPNLSKPAAIAKALESDPDLYSEYQKERV